MTPDDAAQLSAQRACWLLQGLPRGSHIALDLRAAQTDTTFEGYKLVPPGVHCLTWQTASAADGFSASGLRTALLQYTHTQQVLGRRYSAEEDTWHLISNVGDADLVVAPEHLRTLDAHLAPYDADTRWPRLTQHLDADRTTLARVFGVRWGADAVCDSFTPLTEHEDVTSDRELRAPSAAQEGVRFSSGTTHRRTHDARDDADILVEGAASDEELDASSSEDEAPTPSAPSAAVALHITPFALQRSWPREARGIDRTRFSVDKSWLLHDVLTRAADADAAYARSERRPRPPTPLHAPLLREMELVFILFLQANNSAALDHWLALITLFCRASSRLGAPSHYDLHPCEREDAQRVDAPQLDAHIAFMQLLTAQLGALAPEAWAEDLATSEPRVLTDLAELRANIARALGAWAATPHAAERTPPHEALLRAWCALSAATHARFQWTLDAVLDEEAEADELEEGEDAPVIVESGYPYAL